MKSAVFTGLHSRSTVRGERLRQKDLQLEVVSERGHEATLMIHRIARGNTLVLKLTVGSWCPLEGLCRVAWRPEALHLSFISEAN